jgi:hypothetical protein
VNLKHEFIQQAGAAAAEIEQLRRARTVVKSRGTNGPARIIIEGVGPVVLTESELLRVLTQAENRWRTTMTMSLDEASHAPDTDEPFILPTGAQPPQQGK